MAVTLVVEDGTGKPDANSYASVAYADEYHEMRLHRTIWPETGTDPDQIKERALIWATRIIDEKTDWPGTRFSRHQALQWPRYGVVDRDDFPYDSDVIPNWLKDAVSEMARTLIVEDRTAEDDTRGFSEIKVGADHAQDRRR